MTICKDCGGGDLWGADATGCGCEHEAEQLRWRRAQLEQRKVNCYVRPLLYLAAPYWHDDPDVRKTRVRLATAAERELINYGFATLNPIRMSRDVASALSEQAWREHGLSMLRRCDLVVVLRLEGYEKSKGIAAEVAYARALGIKVIEVDQVRSNDGSWLRERSEAMPQTIWHGIVAYDASV